VQFCCCWRQRCGLLFGETCSQQGSGAVVSFLYFEIFGLFFLKKKKFFLEDLHSYCRAVPSDFIPGLTSAVQCRDTVD